MKAFGCVLGFLMRHPDFPIFVKFVVNQNMLRHSLFRRFQSSNSLNETIRLETKVFKIIFKDCS